MKAQVSPESTARAKRTLMAVDSGKCRATHLLIQQYWHMNHGRRRRGEYAPLCLNGTMSISVDFVGRTEVYTTADLVPYLKGNQQTFQDAHGVVVCVVTGKTPRDHKIIIAERDEHVIKALQRKPFRVTRLNVTHVKL